MARAAPDRGRRDESRRPSTMTSVAESPGLHVIRGPILIRIGPITIASFFATQYSRSRSTVRATPTSGQRAMRVLAGRRLRVVEGAGGLVGAEGVGRPEASMSCARSRRYPKSGSGRLTGLRAAFPIPGVFQLECLDAFVASQVAQGFSQITIGNGTSVLERFLAMADKPAWGITEHDRVIAALVKRG
jgi:hypothetical protein